MDAMASLTAGQEVPEHFLEGDSVKAEGDFDVNSYFSVLDHLSMEPGYVLDYVYLADHLGGKPILYARPSDQTPYATYAEFLDAVGGVEQPSYAVYEHADDYLQHVEIDGTADGYFQFVVLWIMGDQFYLFWHGEYNDATIVCDGRGLESVLEEVEAFASEDPDTLEILRRRARRIDFKPTVDSQSDTEVEVRFVTFSKWGGFAELRYIISREFPHEIVDWEVKTLVEYDCGVSF